MENNVVSLNLAKRMKAAGFGQKASHHWVGNELWDATMESDYETGATPGRDSWLAAPTAQEIADELPGGFNIRKTLRDKIAVKDDDDWDWLTTEINTLAEALGELWLNLYESEDNHE